MKKAIVLLLLLIVGMSTDVPQANAQWKKIYTFYDSNGNPEHISCIYFIDLQGSPRIGFAGTTSELWKTVDGGKNWKVVWPRTSAALSYVADIHFKDSLTGWFSYEGDLHNINVYRTNDGGESWQPLNSSKSGFPADGLHYYNASNTLFLSRVDTDMLFSKDFGDSWNPIKTGGTGGFSFFSDSIGIVSASLSYTTNGFLRTTDGGSTWSRSNAIDTDAGSSLQPLAIPGTSICFASTIAHIKIFRSDDYGHTWRLVHDFGPFQDSQYNRIGRYGTGVIGGNLSRLYIQTDTGMYVSTDEGVTWNFDGGPRTFSSTETHRFYCAKGITYAALNTANYPEYDGSLWEEIWPNSGVLYPTQHLPANISIYPNPTTGLVTITGASGAVEVENILGERVSIPHAPSPYPLPKGEGINIDLSRLPAGTYFVRIETLGGVVVKRVVKQ